MRAGPGGNVRNNFGASGERRVLPERQAMKFKAAGVFQGAVEAVWVCDGTPARAGGPPRPA